jgi:hypothetical protein
MVLAVAVRVEADLTRWEQLALDGVDLADQIVGEARDDAPAGRALAGGVVVDGDVVARAGSSGSTQTATPFKPP